MCVAYGHCVHVRVLHRVYMYMCVEYEHRPEMCSVYPLLICFTPDCGLLGSCKWCPIVWCWYMTLMCSYLCASVRHLSVLKLVGLCELFGVSAPERICSLCFCVRTCICVGKWVQWVEFLLFKLLLAGCCTHSLCILIYMHGILVYVCAWVSCC